MTRTSAIFSCMAACVAMALSTGCGGPPRGTVTGTVTMDGEPHKSALVTFTPTGEGGQPAIGKTDEQGRYQLYRRGEEGAQIGSYRVSITTIREAKNTSSVPANVSSDSPEYQAYMESAQRGSAESSPEDLKEPIPARYNTKSELTANVEDGENEFNFEITSE